MSNIITVLAVGDVAGPAGLAYIENNLTAMRREYNADIVVVNGENAAKGNGIDPDAAQRIADAGADVITTGNHVWKWRAFYPMLNDGIRTASKTVPVIRPINYPADAPGEGFTVIDAGGFRLLVMNAVGTVFMDAVYPPIDMTAAALKKLDGKYDACVIDFHAEATSEKAAFARYLGREYGVAAVWGTHTHVPTADNQILPCGTAFITDIGMTGPTNSILGVRQDVVIDRFVTKIPTKFEFAGGACASDCAIIEIDRQTKKAVRISGATY